MASFASACRTLALDMAWSRLRVLSDLGHVDYSWLEPAGWSCSPAVLAFLPGEDPLAVACGQRSPEMMDLLVSRGLDVDVRPQWDGPDVWLVRGRSSEEISGAALELRCICPEEPPAILLAKGLPPLESYIEATSRETQLPFVSTQDQWDPIRNEFMSRPGWNGNGLWRYEDQTRGGRLTYLWLNGGQAFRVGDQDAIKLLLRPVGERVASYQCRDRTFLWNRAVPLPTLYARTLSLCSGYLPVSEGVDWLAFNNVPPLVAAVVCKRLSLSRKEVETQ